MNGSRVGWWMTSPAAAAMVLLLALSALWSYPGRAVAAGEEETAAAVSHAVGVEATAPTATPLSSPTPPADLERLIEEAKGDGEEPPLTCGSGCPWPKYAVSKECCNVFGCNCDGPCWNAGCKTACQKGQYPGRTVSCPGNDGHYNCCPTGSKCKSSKSCSAKKGQCCCTGKGKQIGSISDLTYDFSNATRTPDATSLQVSYKYKGINNGPTAAPTGSIDTTVSSTQTAEWSFESATEVSTNATINAGIPLFADGKLSVGVKETVKYGERRSKTVGTSLKVSAGMDMIPPFSNQEYRFDAAMMQFQIPFKAVAVVIDDCGAESKQTVTGSTRLSGIASFAQNEFTKIVGPAVPVECKAPFDVPIDQQRSGDFCSAGPMCKDNALCVRYGQTSGTCCEAGQEQPCCAVAAAHPRCIEAGYSPERQLCPATNGNFAPCCNDRATLSQTYGQPAQYEPGP